MDGYGILSKNECFGKFAKGILQGIGIINIYEEKIVAVFENGVPIKEMKIMNGKKILRILDRENKFKIFMIEIDQ